MNEFPFQIPALRPPPSPEVATYWNYKIEPTNRTCLGMIDRRCIVAGGKVLGGGSTVNGMHYLRGNRRDFDYWKELGNDNWDYESVLPFYQKNENLISPDLLSIGTSYGKEGKLELSRNIPQDPIRDVILLAAEELGYKNTQVEEDGLGYYDVVHSIGHGIRQSTGRVFLGESRNRSNLFVALGVQVERLTFNQTRVSGVTVNFQNTTRILKARNEVILSAGSIQTPQILKLSGIGPREELETLGIPVIQNLAVGHNYQEHVFFSGFMVKLDPDLVDSPLPLLDSAFNYFVHRTGPLSATTTGSLNALINTFNDSSYPNMEISHSLIPKDSATALRTFLQRICNINDDILEAAIRANLDSALLFFNPFYLHPKSRGRVVLRSTDPQEPPLIFWDPFSHADDLEINLSVIQYLERFIRTEAFSFQHNAELVRFPLEECDLLEYRSDDYWRCSLRYLSSSGYHVTGTCKMGPDNDSQAVVDPRLRVYGVESLRVIDSSIMPEVISGNTNAPAIMIGRKGATMVAEDWGYVIY